MSLELLFLFFLFGVFFFFLGESQVVSILSFFFFFFFICGLSLFDNLLEVVVEVVGGEMASDAGLLARDISRLTARYVCLCV